MKEPRKGQFYIGQGGVRGMETSRRGGSEPEATWGDQQEEAGVFEEQDRSQCGLSGCLRRTAGRREKIEQIWGPFKPL